MATDETFAYFANKKLMPLQFIEEWVFDYLKSVAEAAVAAQYRLSGVYDAATPITSLSVNDVSAAAAFEATDGAGKKFIFGVDDSRLAAVPHENTGAVVYNMGIRSIEIVDELDINPRTGQPEYRSRKETIGTLGIPDAVVDNGADVTLTVDAVTESGVTHAGRTVRVYLVTPKAITWADAYEDVVVAWTGGANKITTTGLLGQTMGSVSTTAADYVVVEIGPVIVRTATEDLTSASGVCFLADWTGTGGGTVSPSTTNQRALTGSLSDLADITRTVNSDLKVSVRAVVADSGDDQIRVEDSGGSRVFGVDETGIVGIYAAVIAAADAITLGSVTERFRAYMINAAMYGATVLDVAHTFNGPVNPTADGQAMGTVTNRWKARVTDITNYNATIAGAHVMSAAKSITLYENILFGIPGNVLLSASEWQAGVSFALGARTPVACWYRDARLAERLYLPLMKLKDGAALQDIRLTWWQDASAGISQMKAGLYKQNNVGVETVIQADTAISGVGAWKDDEAFGSSLAETIDLSTYSYYIKILGANDAGVDFECAITACSHIQDITDLGLAAIS